MIYQAIYMKLAFVNNISGRYLINVKQVFYDGYEQHISPFAVPCVVEYDNGATDIRLLSDLEEATPMEVIYYKA